MTNIWKAKAGPTPVNKSNADLCWTRKKRLSNQPATSWYVPWTEKQCHQMSCNRWIMTYFRINNIIAIWTRNCTRIWTKINRYDYRIDRFVWIALFSLCLKIIGLHLHSMAVGFFNANAVIRIRCECTLLLYILSLSLNSVKSADSSIKHHFTQFLCMRMYSWRKKNISKNEKW